MLAACIQDGSSSVGPCKRTHYLTINDMIEKDSNDMSVEV